MKHYRLSFCETGEEVRATYDPTLKSECPAMVSNGDNEEFDLNTLPARLEHADEVAEKIMSGTYGHTEFASMVKILRRLTEYNDCPRILEAATDVLAKIIQTTEENESARDNPLARAVNLSRAPKRNVGNTQIGIAYGSYRHYGMSHKEACAAIARHAHLSSEQVENICKDMHGSMVLDEDMIETWLEKIREITPRRILKEQALAAQST